MLCKSFQITPRHSVNLLHVIAYGKFACCKKRSARVILIDCFAKCQSINHKTGRRAFHIGLYLFHLAHFNSYLSSKTKIEPDLCKLQYQWFFLLPTLYLAINVLTFLTCFQEIIILVFLEHPRPATVKEDSGPITGFYEVVGRLHRNESWILHHLVKW